MRDASGDERALTEVNSGIYIFRSGDLWPALEGLDADNDQGELYLTDAMGALVAAGRPVVGHRHPDATAALGHQHPRRPGRGRGAPARPHEPRAHARGRHDRRPGDDLDRRRASRSSPTRVIQPFTVLRGETLIEAGADVGPHVVRDRRPCRARCRAWALRYLRPGADSAPARRRGRSSRSRTRRSASARRCPTSPTSATPRSAPTRNRCGQHHRQLRWDTKQRTTIGRDVRSSSDTVFVAPVTIGDGAWTAAGSVITDDIPPDALGVARARQKNIEGYGTRKRSSS